MKKMYLLLAVIAGVLSNNNFSSAQSSTVVSIAGGSGWGSYAGDGLMATDASVRFFRTAGVCADVLGNVYIADWGNYRIRKVEASSGILTTIAGNGTAGFSGDGGPATNANINGMAYPMALTIDNAGNIYYGDNGNNRVRKISTTTGIITTVAGGGSSKANDIPATDANIDPGKLYVDAAGNLYIGLSREIKVVNGITGKINSFAGKGGIWTGYSGDGGPATAAELDEVCGITGDAAGNIYFADRGNHRVRKVDAAGIITTFAGNGTSGYSGDGGDKTSAQLDRPQGLGSDAAGNIYIGDHDGKYIRKVDLSTSKISTIAGCASCYSSGGLISTPVPATSVQTNAEHLCVDLSGNIYYSTYIGWVEKIGGIGSSRIVSDSFSVSKNELCSGPQLSVSVFHYGVGKYLKTDFGDGSPIDSSIVLSGFGGGYAALNHVYTTSGKYTIKEILYDGAAPVDSISFLYNYSFCRTLPVKYYYDGNGNCLKDGMEPYIYRPSKTEVDSNGVNIATISATSGINYNAYGKPGDVYTFRIVTMPGGMQTLCPSSGIWSDTILSSVSNKTPDYVGFNCGTSTAFDLNEYVSVRCGFHFASANIILDNRYCTPENATFSMELSPKYTLLGASPYPTSVSGNTLTWNIPTLSATISKPFNISLGFNSKTSKLTYGDTVNSKYEIIPKSGDENPVDNFLVRVDTVKAGFDPNEMSVSPSGYISSGTQLQYTIDFENTGNDTAFNIYIMDTLSNNVDMTTLNIITGSAAMNVTPLSRNGYNIIRFDFPDINLLDSSHHNECHGMMVFDIKTKTGLKDGIKIFNHAGIYFDANPQVTTNTVENIIGIPTKIASIANTVYVKIYPNPANDELTIDADKDAFKSCSITNSIGQEMMQQAITTAKTKLNIKALPAGLYYVTLKGDNGIKVQKFVKL